MWRLDDRGEFFWQRPSFTQPIAPPTSEVCDPPLYCFSVNEQYIPYIVGALTQLAQPSTWLVTSDADRQVALQRATDLIAEVAAAMPCSPAPVSPPGTPTPQQACNISGYIANFIIKEAILQAVQQAQQNLSIIQFANRLIGFIPGISFWYIIFSSTILQFLTNIVNGNLTDYQTAVQDNTLWTEVTCAILTCIQTDGQVTQSNFPCIQTALCNLSYPLADVKNSICTFIEGLGADQLIAAQAPGAAVAYTCNCSGNIISGPPGNPALQASGTVRVLIAAGQALGHTAVTLLRAFAAPPVLTPGTDNPIMLPSFSGVTAGGFTLNVEAPRPVDVDTYVDVDWIALPPGST